MDRDRKHDRVDGDREPDANLDPITKEPGSHPVGTGLGAAGGAAAGAAIGGAIGGPVGAAIGGTIGAISGGAGGHAAGEAVNPTVEDEYWRNNWQSRPYADRSRGYEHYQPAYRFGWEARDRYRDRDWSDVENNLASDWDRHRESARADLKWDEARLAARDAWQRVRTETGRTGDAQDARNTLDAPDARNARDAYGSDASRTHGEGRPDRPDR